MKLVDYLYLTGLTNREFAEKCGFSPHYISYLRQGSIQPSQKAIMAIETATNGLVSGIELKGYKKPNKIIAEQITKLLEERDGP